MKARISASMFKQWIAILIVNLKSTSSGREAGFSTTNVLLGSNFSKGKLYCSKNPHSVWDSVISPELVERGKKLIVR